VAAEVMTIKFAPPHTIDPSIVNSPIARDVSPKLIWENDVRLTINNLGFYLSIDTEELKSGKSTSDSFLLGKSKHQAKNRFLLDNSKGSIKFLKWEYFKVGVLCFMTRYLALKK
jgi:hypothetical protein